MDLQLADARGIVLAASGGIGRASAEALVREGATVAICSRSQSNLDDARAAMLERTGADGDRVRTFVCDLADPDAVGPAVEAAVDDLGGLDVLVTNTAGPPKIPFAEASLEAFDEAYTYILRSVIAAIEAALPALLDSDRPAITNLLATAAQRPEANHVLANTFRPGVYGLAKTLANEYAEAGVRVNNVCPKKVGPVTQRERERTSHIGRYAEVHGLDYDEARERYIAETIPLGSHGDLEEFGDAVAFVSSPRVSHVTGASLNVDGGWNPALF